MQQELAALGEGLSMAALQLDEARDKARLARSIAETLGSKVKELRRLGTSLRAIEVIYHKLQEAKAKRGVLESTVLTLTSAVTRLMESAVGGGGPKTGLTYGKLERCLLAQEEAANGQLDSICQEMKGGGITIGGVVFSGREAAMNWARLHLPPNTYQCIGGMVYMMCLISKAVVHQEDMMKREEHWEHVKRMFMQSAQVLLVHTSYPPVLDGAKSAKRDGLTNFLELCTYKQWKPVDGEGTCKRLKEGVEHSFELIRNVIESMFGMKLHAQMVLLELVRKFKNLFYNLFVMEVNRFYEEMLNKVRGEHPSKASRIQCWALVAKLLKMVFKSTHKMQSFATEAGGG
jgi:hypothetical protein